MACRLMQILDLHNKLKKPGVAWSYLDALSLKIALGNDVDPLSGGDDSFGQKEISAVLFGGFHSAEL